MSPDPYMADDSGGSDPSDPGSWNRYAYAGGDPINYNDPSGLYRCIVGYSNYIFNGQPVEGGPIWGECTVPIEKVPIWNIPPGTGNSGGGSGGGVDSRTAIYIFKNDAKALAKKSKFKQPCLDDFSALGTTAADIKAAAAHVDIEDGTNNSALVSSLYMNTPQYGNAQSQYGTLTIGQYQTQNAGTVAQAQLNGNMVYINPALIGANDYYQNISVLLHELLHNVTGLTDSDIQNKLFGFSGGVSDNITQRLKKDCF